MTKYAENTSVSIQESRNEIERVLQRYGADGFAFGTADGQSLVAFRIEGHQVRIAVKMPDPENHKLDRRGYTRGEESLQKALDTASRQRWRALLLVIKAKLEAIETGITTFEDEFLAHWVTSDGATVGEKIRPQLRQMIDFGRVPALMPGMESRPPKT